MSTITITNVNPTMQKAIIAVCKALGIANYKVTKDEEKAAENAAKQLHQQKMAETKTAIQSHLKGNRAGYRSFDNADDLAKAVLVSAFFC